MSMTTPLLDMEGVHKRFVLHLQNQTVLHVLHDFSLRVLPGECVRLSGPSGMGKSTVLKLAFGNYQASAGRIALRARHRPHDNAQKHDEPENVKGMYHISYLASAFI